MLRAWGDRGSLMQKNIKQKRPLVPRNVFEIQGKLSYSESLQAWNTLRFKKELVKEFPQLSEKRSKFSYSLVYYRTLEEFEKAIKQLKEDKTNLPILLFLNKEVD